jgi:hypothetical protein
MEFWQRNLLECGYWEDWEGDGYDNTPLEFMKIGYEGVNWVMLAEDHGQCLGLVLAVLKIWILLPEC